MVEELLVALRGDAQSLLAATQAGTRGVQQFTAQVDAMGRTWQATTSGLVLPPAVAASARQAEAAVTALQASASRTAPAMRGAASSTAELSGAQGAANRVAIEGARIINDLQVGAMSGFRGILIAVSNQIEGFISALRTAKAEGATLRQVLSGPAGLALGLNAAATAAVLAGPVIAEMFASSGEAARQADEFYRDALGSVLQFQIADDARAVRSLQVAQRLEGFYSTRRDASRKTLEELQREQAALAERMSGSNLNRGIVPTDAEFARYADLPGLISEAQTETDRYRGRWAEVNEELQGALERTEALRELGPFDLPLANPPRTRTPRTRDMETQADVVGELERAMRAIAADAGTITEATGRPLITGLQAAEERAQALRGALDTLQNLPAGRGQTAAQIDAIRERAAAAEATLRQLSAEVDRVVVRDPFGSGALTGAGRQNEAVRAGGGVGRDAGTVNVEGVREIIEAFRGAEVFVTATEHIGTLEEVSIRAFGAMHEAAGPLVETLAGDLAEAFVGLASLQGGFEDFADSVVDAMGALVTGVALAVAESLILFGILKLLDTYFPGAGRFVAATLGVSAGVLYGGSESAGVSSVAGASSLAVAQTGPSVSGLEGGHIVTRTPVGLIPAAQARAGLLATRTGLGSRS